MNPKLVRAFTVGAIAVGASTIAHAQQTSSASQNVDLGKYYYESHCAICHQVAQVNPQTLVGVC
jgi:mono/diheme cytochrome c family protein